MSNDYELFKRGQWLLTDNRNRPRAVIPSMSHVVVHIVQTTNGLITVSSVGKKHHTLKEVSSLKWITVSKYWSSNKTNFG